ncbi:MAG: HAMP domain-containing protein [Gemmatimonadaceae bacterium]|nr:HAMP domain-containing protein [Gemmatimonadaceae bacterium]
MRWWPSSLRARITLWFAVVLGVPLVAFAAVSYVVFDRTLLARTDHFMGDALSAFARELANERRVASSNAVAAQTTAYEVHFRQLQIVIADSAGALLAASAVEAGAESQAADVAPLDPARVLDAASRPDADGEYRTMDEPGGAYRVHARTLQLAGEPLILIGIAPLHDIEAVLARVRGAFLIALPLLLAAAAGGGFFMARRSLAPVSAMGAQAAAITDANLHERLPVVTPNDELGGLATVINSLLDRLERAFAQQRRFMADASHELRTPTAILTTEAQVTLSREHRSEGEYRESVTVMQGAAERLTRIVDDLVLLGRADAGHLVARHRDIYLDEVVHNATRAIRPIADRRGVRVELLPVTDAPFHGDADLLGRLLLNLLDNAIKFAVGSGTVSVELVAHGDGGTPSYEIRVVDDGPGIPAELQERVFERFFRGDPARGRVEPTETSGAGLGLAISRRIAEAHGGTLALVTSRPGRTEFCLTLPSPEVPLTHENAAEARA